jgi:hypothetical protein
MSFVLHGLHEQQQHAHYLVYNFQDGRTICLACFLHSLSDPGHLDSKKHFAVRCVAAAAAIFHKTPAQLMQQRQYSTQQCSCKLLPSTAFAAGCSCVLLLLFKPSWSNKH